MDNDSTAVNPYRYLFGPVPSRRLGRSLGVDLIPFKTCSYDCIFCQLGRTTRKTVRRSPFIPIEDVLAEITAWADAGGSADYITLSGSGEPTLHSGFGDILAWAAYGDTPSVLLTNGATFSDPAVREAACHADIVKISLSAWDQKSFETLNRPHPALRFSDIVAAQKHFRTQYRGELWIEVFLVSGVNGAPGEVDKIAALVNDIHPDRIHLNTVVRPPAETFARKVPGNQMAAYTRLFDPPAEIIAECRSDRRTPVSADEASILALLQRRPCTRDQIADAFHLHINEASKYLGKLLSTGRIHMVDGTAGGYYSATTPPAPRADS